jgi:hypothetical protein
MRIVALGIAAIALLAWAGSCAESDPTIESRPLEHEAYIWQRAWTGAVEQSVKQAPTELGALRVLAAEVERSGTVTWIHPDTDALAATRRPVTAVMRINGARLPEAVPTAALVARVQAWQSAGVQVRGIEIDHDSATANLPAYARWLRRTRPPAPLRWSITALPTWTESTALAKVADAVDELVVQVHAIRAPRLFDPDAAARWLRAVSKATVGHPMRAALPTYRIDANRAANPARVAALLRTLEGRPVTGLRGVVWFRLPVRGDVAAWSRDTLRAVIRGDELRATVGSRLVRRAPGSYDLVIENRGTVDAPWPRLALRGAAGADLVRGYHRRGDFWIPPRRLLRAGQRAVVGWATGEEINVDVVEDPGPR